MTLKDNIQAIIECNFSEAKEEIQERAADLIFKLFLGSVTSEHEWISTKNHLPEITRFGICSDDCLVTYDEGIYIARYFKTDKGEFWDDGGKILDKTLVTAWRPLPEPYKGGQDD